eukprot:COSAG06_NODE_26348_length_616_cov_4.270793_1_plen_71_part_10
MGFDLELITRLLVERLREDQADAERPGHRHADLDPGADHQERDLRALPAGQQGHPALQLQDPAVPEGGERR